MKNGCFVFGIVNSVSEVSKVFLFFGKDVRVCRSNSMECFHVKDRKTDLSLKWSLSINLV